MWFEMQWTYIFKILTSLTGGCFQFQMLMRFFVCKLLAHAAVRDSVSRPFHTGCGSRECLVNFNGRQWETCGKQQFVSGFAGGVEAEQKRCSLTQNPAAFISMALKIFYLFVSGSRVGFNQSVNRLLTTNHRTFN